MVSGHGSVGRSRKKLIIGKTIPRLVAIYANRDRLWRQELETDRSSNELGPLVDSTFDRAELSDAVMIADLE